MLIAKRKAMAVVAERCALAAATAAARVLIAQSHDRRLTIGRSEPGEVAYHVAWAVLAAHREAYDMALSNLYLAETGVAYPTADEVLARLWGCDDAAPQ